MIHQREFANLLPWWHPKRKAQRYLYRHNCTYYQGGACLREGWRLSNCMSIKSCHEFSLDGIHWIDAPNR